MTTTEFNDLLFNVRRSIRYHEKRQNFYEGCYKFVLFVGFFSGPAFILIKGSDMPDWYIYIPSVTVSILTGISLVYSWHQKALLHIDLKREFISLEIELEAGRKNPTPELIEAVTTKMLHAEAKEPPILRVLNIVCHNELGLAMGYQQKDLYRIRFYQRALKHFIDWNPNSIQLHGA